MKRIAIVLICLACAAGGFAIKAILENDIIAGFLRDYGLWIAVTGLASLIVLGLIFVLSYLFLRYRLRELLKADGAMTEAEIAAGLVDILTTPEGITNPTSEDRRRAALVNIATWLMRRHAAQFYFNATITIVGGLMGTATLFLLYEQNQKITLQTDANITQSVLLEGTRRDNLAADLASLLNDIRMAPSLAIDATCPESTMSPTFERCWEGDRSTPNAQFHLPDDLAIRVSDFLWSSTPYRLAIPNNNSLEFDSPLRDQYDFPALSPERGQLLETLVRNRINIDMEGFDFSSAQLSGTRLEGNNLSGALLNGAYLRDAKLFGSNLRDVSLDGAELNQALLSSSTLIRATLRHANLQGSWLINADLRGADLTNADLTSADLREANLRGTILRNAILKNANLRGANLSGIDAAGSIIDETDLSGAWAWSDEPPKGLPNYVQLALCEPPVRDEMQVTRPNRPRNCR